MGQSGKKFKHKRPGKRCKLQDVRRAAQAQNARSYVSEVNTELKKIWTIIETTGYMGIKRHFNFSVSCHTAAFKSGVGRKKLFYNHQS